MSCYPATLRLAAAGIGIIWLPERSCQGFACMPCISICFLCFLHASMHAAHAIDLVCRLQNRRCAHVCLTLYVCLAGLALSFTLPVEAYTGRFTPASDPSDPPLLRSVLWLCHDQSSRLCHLLSSTALFGTYEPVSSFGSRAFL